jgi:Ca-activated chloride channel family protein
MIEFSYPFAFVLLALPFLIALLPWSYKTQKAALNFPSFGMLEKAHLHEGGTEPITKASWSEKLVAYVVFALVVVALAKPVQIQEPVVKEESLREILICVDLSASMEAKDFTLPSGEVVDRLAAQKSILHDFFDTLPHENFALIFYGSAAFVQSPFTNDTNATKQLLDEAQIGMAGPKTVIGDAIGLGIKLFDESKIKERLVILMSDGSDSGSKVEPLRAAGLAKAANIKIETIAVGDLSATGEERVDTQTLQDIASTTGGNFYFAEDSKSLANIYNEIDKLHPKKVKTHSYNPTIELFPYPLILACSVLMLFGMWKFVVGVMRRRDV